MHRAPYDKFTTYNTQPYKGLGLYPEKTIFPISGSVSTSNAAASTPMPYLVNQSILRNHVRE